MTEPTPVEMFEQHRGHLQAVAYRMLGSSAEAEDAVQETWLRLHRTDVSDVDNLGGWLTTVVSRIALNMLRQRSTRREASYGEEVERHADPLVVLDGGHQPEEQALLADAVGVALLLVLDQLSPAERLAFVLHDMFAVPFEEIAPIVDRSPAATRQLASRARRRVTGTGSRGVVDRPRRREVVDAFFAAAHDGDLERLVAVLHPDVVLHSDLGALGGRKTYRGAETVAGNAVLFADPDRLVHPALVDGRTGVAITLHGELFSVMAFDVDEDGISQIEVYADPEQLARSRAGLPELPGLPGEA